MDDSNIFEWLEDRKKGVTRFKEVLEEEDNPTEATLCEISIDNYDRLKEAVTNLYYILVRACVIDYKTLKADSMAISDYRDGLKLLEKLGLFEVESEDGRRIIGRFKVIDDE